MSAILCNYNHSEGSSRFILPLPVGSQTHLKSPNHSHLDNVVFDRRKVVRSRPFPIRWLFGARKTHLQPIAKCSRSYNSKENAHPKFSVIDVHSNADGIIVYSKANGLGVHSKVTVWIRPKPSAPHAVIFDLDTSHPAKASITMYVRCRPPHRTSGQSYNRHVNPYPASTLRYTAVAPRLFAQGLGHPDFSISLVAPKT